MQTAILSAQRCTFIYISTCIASVAKLFDLAISKAAYNTRGRMARKRSHLPKLLRTFRRCLFCDMRYTTAIMWTDGSILAFCLNSCSPFKVAHTFLRRRFDFYSDGKTSRAIFIFVGVYALRVEKFCACMVSFELANRERFQPLHAHQSSTFKAQHKLLRS